MPFMRWTHRLSVGVAILDDDHKRLIGIINQLHYGITAGHKRDILQAILGQLVNYTRVHFSREEDLFEQCNYPCALEHMLEHAGFIGRIAELHARLKSEPADLLNKELMNLLKKWLITHIQVSDKKY